jgi:hypothetical protein
MANIDSVFPSTYLRASDLNGAEPIVTIERAAVESLGQGARAEQKIVVYFKGKSKGLVCNKTNAHQIADLCGSRDYDDWPGHNVKLITMQVEYQGKRVPAIRVESAGKAKAAPVSEPPVSVDADDIPF